MKSKFKEFLVILLSYALAMIVILIFGNAILLPICNSIFIDGLAVTQTIMQIMLPFFAFIIIFICKRDGSEEKITFKAKCREEPYDAKNDLKNIIKSMGFWSEMIFIVVITVIFWLCNPAFNIILINIPLYFVFNLATSLGLHRHWAKNTLHH